MVRMRYGIAALGIAVLGIAAAGCGQPPMLETLAPDQTCRRTVAVGTAAEMVAPANGETREPEIADEVGDRDGAAVAVETEWLTPRDDLERGQLNAWCAAAGPAVAGGWPDASTEPVDSLAIVSWNVHIGGGDLERLVRDLREGRLTGQPVRHFALLLQEAHRTGDLVPEWQDGFPFGSGDPLTPPGGPARDVVEHAQAMGLAVFYAPSMRSGQGAGGAASDRGNAILSTLPMAAFRAIELPVARQRRVAAVAMVRGMTSTGEEWELEVASAHLENDARGWANDARARVLQAEALLEGLSDDGPAVVAGDFNSWTLGPDEAVVHTMLDEFEETPPFPPGPTYVRGFGFVRRYLDYMFFRLPDDDARVRYRRLDDLYNSDHYPLMGWVVFPRD
ncbi:MAG TPA: endonuclease/exonuclease/phosphatase family protein [Longimicrobiales bacterium]|nr:endonuclease/exonuclease/phosphatase family protein [Longimicrobiales bacterium]